MHTLIRRILRAVRVVVCPKKLVGMRQDAGWQIRMPMSAASDRQWLVSLARACSRVIDTVPGMLSLRMHA